MTMSSTDFVKLISSLKEPAFGIPTDVTFNIMSYSNLPTERDEEYVLGEVNGHKFLLGLFSPVFKRQFFGIAKETTDTIPVRQTTFEAFEKMIDYIYQKAVDWSQLSVLDLFDVVNLAEKYEITGLMEEMKEQMTNIPITMENLMDIANTATQFHHFSIASSALMLSCAKFLRITHQTSDELVKFAADQAGKVHGGIVMNLFALVRELPPAKCTNCGEVECLNGEVIVNHGKFTPGLKLVVNRQNIDLVENCGPLVDKLFTVTTNTQTTGIVIVSSQDEELMQFLVLSEPHQLPTLCYKCD